MSILSFIKNIFKKPTPIEVKSEVTPVDVISQSISKDGIELLKEHIISQHGEDLIKSFEGLSLKVYKDSAGYPTIGWGHLILKGEDFSAGITRQQADDMFLKELVPFENNINKVVHVPLTQDQFDALVSFSYNVGINAFNRSTLLSQLNKGNYNAAAQQFLRWNRAGGRVIKGLTNRRQQESNLFKE